ncbi:MAG: Zn-dependent exopeptidase M28 [Bacteroidia bacterium]|nr:Zn-dependent exopeptidase M28 [Bacteroidia bacterium]
MRILFFLLFTLNFLFSQDSAYVRGVIKELTKKKYYGRGYTKNGLNKASDYLVKECKRNGAKPLFGLNYVQPYQHPVNTYPGKMNVTINGKKLIPGRDFIIKPSSGSVKASFNFTKKDSVTYFAESNNAKCKIVLQKKLTYSVGTKLQFNECEVQLLKSRFTDEIKTAKVNIDARFIPEFKTNNVGALIEGENNDSIIIFTAHYDHLGGMGKKCFFPGANDNASGTAFVLNLMKHYAKNKPKYKTVFIFFSSEEAGLIGSKYFVENSPIPLSAVKFLINLDLLGTGDDGIMAVNGAILENQFKLLEKINTENKFVKEIKKRGKASNSDHYWFTEKGVPAFFIYTLGGVSFYHDIDDVEKTLPLTKYKEVFQLITTFVNEL